MRQKCSCTDLFFFKHAKQTVYTLFYKFQQGFLTFVSLLLPGL